MAAAFSDQKLNRKARPAVTKPGLIVLDGVQASSEHWN